MSAPNLRFDRAYVIVRFDGFHDDADPETAITVKKVVWDQATAEREVERLNRLNAEKGCVYFWQMTRVERTVNPTLAGEPAEHMPEQVSQ
jgi:hypothetical protein